jgi:hypothetical protein
LGLLSLLHVTDVRPIPKFNASAATVQSEYEHGLSHMARQCAYPGLLPKTKVSRERGYLHGRQSHRLAQYPDSF